MTFQTVMGNCGTFDELNEFFLKKRNIGCFKEKCMHEMENAKIGAASCFPLDSQAIPQKCAYLLKETIPQNAS